MTALLTLIALLLFPGGLALLAAGLAFEWGDRKLLARLQNRVGPRWYQPAADVLKLLANEEVAPERALPWLFHGLPVVALAGALTAALYTPLFGLPPVAGFEGDLVVALYLLSLLTICTGLAGAHTANRFSLLGAVRALTQLFAYEAPFLLALLGPAVAAGSWRISEVAAYAQTHPVWLMQPLGLLVALVGLLGKLELPPFDAPEAETEIVAGALTEYSGRGLAIFRLARAVELVVGLTLVTALFLGGVGSGPLAPFWFTLKTIGLLVGIAIWQSAATRLRIDQTVGVWQQVGVLLVLLQWLALIGLAQLR